MAAPKKTPNPAPWRVDPERFKKARADAKLSQIDLCIRSDEAGNRVSIRTISRLETGTHEGSPSLADVGLLADLMRVELDWLCARPKS